MLKITKMTTPTCIIWGRNDKTPPNAAEEFNKLLPNSELFLGLKNVDMQP